MYKGWVEKSTFDPSIKGSRPLEQQQIGINIGRKVHLDHTNVIHFGGRGGRVVCGEGLWILKDKWERRQLVLRVSSRVRSVY